VAPFTSRSNETKEKRSEQKQGRRNRMYVCPTACLNVGFWRRNYFRRTHTGCVCVWAWCLRRASININDAEDRHSAGTRKREMISKERSENHERPWQNFWLPFFIRRGIKIAAHSGIFIKNFILAASFHVINIKSQRARARSLAETGTASLRGALCTRRKDARVCI